MRLLKVKDPSWLTIFQSTHPSWGATSAESDCLIQYQFQSTHPSWGATLKYLLYPSFWTSISIHAPIVGCDFRRVCVFLSFSYFNPRTHRGVRPSSAVIIVIWLQFQSTHPSWGATTACESSFHPLIISIHAPIVGCDLNSFKVLPSVTLFQSTHPSWGATLIHLFPTFPLLFQSTHPSWGATTYRRKGKVKKMISIHAPIVGCDHNDI